MAYCWCISQEAHLGVRNRAPAPLPFLDGPGSIIDTYEQKFGVPADKLGILFGWFGCDFECTNNATDPDGAYAGCPVVEKAFRSPTYGSIVRDLLPNATNGGVRLNATLQSKFFNFRGEGDELRQVWYDDPETLGAKYALAKRKGLRALGMWVADDVYPLGGGDVQAMWDALP